MTEHDSTLDINGATLSYSLFDLDEPWRTDHRPTVVMQHGLGLDRTVWRPWIRQFIDSYRIVCLDLRGHGESASAWRDDDCGFDRFVDDIIVLADHLGIDSFDYVGESFGGTMGLALGSRFPDRVRSLITCSTAFRGTMITNVRHWEDLIRTEGLPAWSEEILRGRFIPGGVSDEAIEWVARLQLGLEPDVVIGIVNCLLSVDLIDEVSGLGVPLCVIGAANSPFVSVETTLTLHQTVPHSDLVLIPNGAHGLVISHWERCSAAARQFVERQSV